MSDRILTPPGLAIETAQIDGSYTIRLIGEFDMTGREAVEQVLRQAEDSDATRILIDLAGLDFVDSTGLIVFVAATRSDERADRLRFTPARGQVAKIFSLTGLDATLTFGAS